MVGAATLSSVVVSGAHAVDALAALTDGYEFALAMAIAVAALGITAASLPLGRSRAPEAVARPSRPPPDQHERTRSQR